MRNFQELVIWQKSHQITLKIYSITAGFPSREMFGLTSQMRRSAASSPTNIAEGSCKNSDAEMRRFLFISTGSSSELEYQLILAKDLNYIDAVIFNELQSEVVITRRMIYSFAEKLK